MCLRSTAIALVLGVFPLPLAAIAGNVDARSGDVRVSIRDDGSIYANTGETRVYVPSDRRSSPSGYWSCRQGRGRWSYQRSTQRQITRNSVARTRVSTLKCR